MLEALNKRIEEKIDNCNSILDEIDNSPNTFDKV
nr:MAG TPA: hypothetical protein [Caudoviricetes sp.]